MKEYGCDDKEGLVAYLYDEIGAAQRRAVEAHLATCQECAAEIDTLSEVRRDLVEWLPPESDLGFTIVQKPAAVLRPARWRAALVPAWAQVAAAVLLLAAGVAIANVRVRYDSSGITVSTGWMHGASGAAPAAASVGMATSGSTVGLDQEWRTALASLEADLRRQMQTVRQESAPVTASSAVVGASDAALLKRVQALIDASEQRQRQELALRLTQFGRDVELQRRADLVRIEQGVGQWQGRTGAEVARQRELLNYVVRVSGRQVPE
jgi:anti-sigma factor RsiW